MEWTWVTFFCLSLGFCILAVAIAGWTKSKSLEVNQAEMIDIDAEQQLVRGTIFAHVYSPRTATYHLGIASSNGCTGAIEQRWMTWQGLPGGGLGGMQTRSDLGLYRRQYQCDLTRLEGELSGCALAMVPMQTAATKSVLGRWTSRLEHPPASQLRQNPNTNAVLGTFSNPLPVSLTNCVLLYGGWAYLLDRTLAPGETIDVATELREKTIRGHYTRRRQAGQDELNTAWNALDTSLARIGNMMMFYDAIGGEGYTKLSHDYQAYLDLSDQLEMGRAILVGQMHDVATELIINDQSAAGYYDKKFTFVRVVFPVESREAKR